MISGRQPLLHDALVVLRAPVQLWSRGDGTMSQPIDGVYCGDVRVARALRVEIGGEAPEHIATTDLRADRASIHGLIRGLDDPVPDPGLRMEIERRVDQGGWTERLRIVSRLDRPVSADVSIVFVADATAMESVKRGDAGGSARVELTDAGVAWNAEGVEVELTPDGMTASFDAGRVTLSGPLIVPAHGSVEVGLRLDAHDPGAPVRGTTLPVPWSAMPTDVADPTLARWLSRAIDDLDALRMEAVAVPGRQFLAAGAPWFFTLFGRDSLWSARLLLPLGTALAADTLHVLAAMQGTRVDADSAEAPGKIMHELRRQALSAEDGVVLPPRYYGTVDATPLWIALLHDAWRGGLTDDEVRALLPHLDRALAWLRDHADPDGDGLLEYVDESGHGLANQGWKDSGDSIRWRDGSLAEPPIALSEVQAYAFEAALGAADLLDEVAGDHERAEQWRAWAHRLRERFQAAFWIDDEAGGYPAIALDRDKRPVDGIASNMGHLLGTGILTPDQERAVAHRLVTPEFSSGLGLRTMSTDNAGYWPLSYHCGTVWAHDTAIAIRGLARGGFHVEARVLADGLLAAAEGFEYRMPELHSGDPWRGAAAPAPIPYPAACRPQAWSAAAAVAVADALATGMSTA